MSKKRELDCIQRFMVVRPFLEEVTSFLLDESLIDNTDLDKIRLSQNKGQYIYNLLQELKVQNKIQLLSFEWHVLPYEKIKLTLVTDKVVKEFSFSEW